MTCSRARILGFHRALPLTWNEWVRVREHDAFGTFWRQRNSGVARTIIKNMPCPLIQHQANQGQGARFHSCLACLLKRASVTGHLEYSKVSRPKRHSSILWSILGWWRLGRCFIGHGSILTLNTHKKQVQRQRRWIRERRTSACIIASYNGLICAYQESATEIKTSPMRPAWLKESKKKKEKVVHACACSRRRITHGSPHAHPACGITRWLWWCLDLAILGSLSFSSCGDGLGSMDISCDVEGCGAVLGRRRALKTRMHFVHGIHYDRELIRRRQEDWKNTQTSSHRGVDRRLFHVVVLVLYSSFIRRDDDPPEQESLTGMRCLHGSAPCRGSQQEAFISCHGGRGTLWIT